MASGALQNMARTSEHARNAIANYDNMQPFLGLLCGSTASKRHAARIIWNISLSGPQLSQQIVQAGIIGPLIDIFCGNDEDIASDAAGAIFNIISYEETRRMIPRDQVEQLHQAAEQAVVHGVNWANSVLEVSQDLLQQ